MENEVEKRLKSKINEVIKGRHDKEQALAKVKELLAIKDEMGVEPVEIHIPTKDVIKEYNFGGLTITKTKKEYIYHQNGYTIIVKPWIRALYGLMDNITYMDDNKDVLGKDSEELKTTLISALQISASLPLVMFTDDEFMSKIYMYLVNEMADLFKKHSQFVESEDDEVENEEFRNKVEMFDKIKDSVNEKE